MANYGVFNDEGCIESGFNSRDEALQAQQQTYADDDTHVAEVCSEHEGYERYYCDICNADTDEDTN